MKEYTDIIAKYLRGEMQGKEKTDFESSLKTNAELRTEFEVQKNIVMALQRLQTKNQLQKGMKSAKLKKTLVKTAITIALTGLAVAIVFAGYKALKSDSEVHFELNETGTKAWTKADQYLPSQFHEINPDRDTIIETENGIVFAIPAGAFVTKDNNKVQLEIKEALNALDIVKAGLSTMSGGELLETGGMFYVNAREGEKPLAIYNGKEIKVSVPDLNPGKQMQLFKGIRSGTEGETDTEAHSLTGEEEIIWVDPQPIAKKVAVVDVTGLDFYPKGFLDMIKKQGWNHKNKKLTDSIFYAMTCPQLPAAPQKQPVQEQSLVAQPTDFPLTARKDTMGRPIIVNAALSMSYYSISDSVKYPSVQNCGILPTSIKAIWNKKYASTILATKEFEERLQSIYQTCNPAVLQLYVEHLDWDMYRIDSLASELLGEGDNGTFRKYSNRRTGGVKIKTGLEKKLAEHFIEKEKEFKAIAEAAAEEVRKKDQEDINAYWDKVNKHSDEEAIRLSAFIQGEIEINMEEAYRQLGKSKPKVPPFTGNYVNTNIQSTGWYNVDKYVIAATVNRTNMDYTDPETGKTARLEYKPFTAQILDQEKYDNITFYLLPKQLNSYQKIIGRKGKFSENLNSLFQYSALVIANKGSKQFGAYLESVGPGEISIALKPFSDQDIKRACGNRGEQGNEIIAAQAFDKWQSEKEKVNKARTERLALTRELQPIVFPCATIPKWASESDAAVPQH